MEGKNEEERKQCGRGKEQERSGKEKKKQGGKGEGNEKMM